MSDDKPRLCPDCQGQMNPINLHDKYDPAGFHQPLEYSLPVGQKTFWTGGYPVAGTVGGSMCGACGRIVMHAIPKAK